jgi:hypothetical protein
MRVNHLIVFVREKLIFTSVIDYSILLAVHLGPVSKVVMVLGGLHKRLSDVPDTISYVLINVYFEHLIIIYVYEFF